jgi:hypothetical protein
VGEAKKWATLRPLLHRLVLERSIWHCNFDQLCL